MRFCKVCNSLYYIEHEGNNLMLLPLDKIINTTELEENLEDDEENNEFMSSETNNREGR